MPRYFGLLLLLASVSVAGCGGRSVQSIDEGKLALANAALDRGEFDTAITGYRQLLEQWPDAAILHHNLGVALAKKEDRKGAIAECRQAVRLEPTKAKYRHTLGVMLADHGSLLSRATSDDMQEACKEYNEAMSLAVSLKKAYGQLYAKAFRDLADIKRRGGLRAESIVLCKTAIDLNPEDPESHLILGLCYHELGRQDESIPSLRDVVRHTNPPLTRGAAIAKHTIGKILEEKGDTEGAVTAYREAIDHYNTYYRAVTLQPPEQVLRFSAGSRESRACPPWPRSWTTPSSRPSAPAP